MSEIPSNKLDEAIARAKEQVAEEVKDAVGDADLDTVAGGAGDEEIAWEISVSYKTTAT